MKTSTISIFSIIIFLVACAPASIPLPTSTITLSPTETITPTATQTFTPIPPTLTFTPTPIPLVEDNYPEVMQVAIFNPYFEAKWPNTAFSIAQIKYDGFGYFDDSPEDRFYSWKLVKDSIIQVLDPNEYKEVRGVGWSPNGKYFIYAASNVPGAIYSSCHDLCDGIDLWIVSNDGTFKMLLSSETKLSHEQISWHPNETKFITFCPSASETAFNNREVCIVQISSGDIEHTGLFGLTALYSPTGDSFIYTQGPADVTEHKYEYFIVKETEINPRKILTFEVNYFVNEDADFVWSPDGKYIYSIQKANNGSSALYRISLDGTKEQMTVTMDKKRLIESISPNGSYILMCNVFQDECEVYDVNSLKLIPLPNYDDFPPYWHPNSTLKTDDYVINFREDTKQEISYYMEYNNLLHDLEPYSNLYFAKMP